MKRRKTGVRSPRKPPRAPTRAKAVKAGTRPSRVKAGVSSSPFRSEWKYLNVEESPRRQGRVTGDAARKTGRTRRVAGSTPAVTYFESPPVRKPFRDFTDEEVIVYYLAMPGDRRRRVLENTAMWKWYERNKHDKEKITSLRSVQAINAMHDHVHRQAMMIPPSMTEIATFLRRFFSGPPCPCGYMGYPYEDHTLDARKCFKYKPVALEDDDDDDFPF